MSPVRPMKRPRGFSLIELCVAIGIIAVLLALLAAGLNRARTLSSRAVCANNLRQIGVLYTVYAGRYADQVPLGSTWLPQISFEMAFYSPPPGPRWYLLCGCLYAAGLVQEPRIFYEPDLYTDEHGGFNTDGNPWPPGSTPAAPWGETICDYSCRPWWDGSGNNTVWLPPTLFGPPLPRISQLSHLAILADWNWGNLALDERHMSGINVLYGDGGVQWVARPLYQADLDAQDAENWSVDNGYTDDLWSLLDSAR